MFLFTNIPTLKLLIIIFLNPFIIIIKPIDQHVVKLLEKFNLKFDFIFRNSACNRARVQSPRNSVILLYIILEIIIYSIATILISCLFRTTKHTGFEQPS